MARRYSLVCEDDVARRIERLSREYELTEEEVLRQLLELGLTNLDPE